MKTEKYSSHKPGKRLISSFKEIEMLADEGAITKGQRSTAYDEVYDNMASAILITDEIINFMTGCKTNDL